MQYFLLSLRSRAANGIMMPLARRIELVHFQLGPILGSRAHHCFMLPWMFAISSAVARYENYRTRNFPYMPSLAWPGIWQT